MSILNFILGGLGYHKGKKCWDTYDIYTNLKKFMGSNTLPLYGKWPACIFLNSGFWQGVKDAHYDTVKDGHERAIGVVWAAGELLMVPMIRGEQDKVLIHMGMKLMYDPLDETRATKRVFVNGDEVLHKAVFYKDIPAKPELFYLFHLHTHPPQQYNSSTDVEDQYYSYFSRQDIYSFLSSSQALTGLISEGIHLLAKSNDTPDSLPEHVTDYDITPEYLINELKLVVYKASFQQQTFERTTLQVDSNSKQVT